MPDGEVYVVIKGKDTTKPVVDKAERRLKGFTDSVKGMSLGNIAALTGVALGMGKIVSAASDVEESLNKVREVFGTATVKVEDFSRTARTSIGASRQAALEMTGTIGNLLTSFGLTDNAAADMSIQVVKLAADIGSFNNVATDDALIAIRAALVGSSEPMLRFGADTRVTRLEQIALEKGLITAGQQMNAQQRALMALEAITRDTAKAAGDFTRTSDSLANKTKIVKAQFDDLVATVGESFLPVAQTALGLFSDLMNIFTALPPSTQTAIVALGALGIAVKALGVNIATLMVSIGPAGWVILGLGALATALIHVNENLTLSNEQFPVFTEHLHDISEAAGGGVEGLEAVADAMAKMPMYDIPELPHLEAEKKLKESMEKQAEIVTEGAEQRNLINMEADLAYLESLEQTLSERYDMEEEARMVGLENYRLTKEAEAAAEYQALMKKQEMHRKGSDVYLANLGVQINKEKELRTKELAFHKWMEAQKRQASLETLANIADMLVSFAGRNAAVVKAGLTAQAIMDTYAGANRALGAYPPPFSYVLAASVIAKGLANVAQIHGAGMATGGVVHEIIHAQGGAMPAGTDVVPAMLTPGEAVISREGVRRNQGVVSRLIGGETLVGGGGVQISVINNISSIDTAGVRDFVQGDDFKISFVNALNDKRIRLALGIDEEVRGVM